jgi:hypothetical protein
MRIPVLRKIGRAGYPSPPSPGKGKGTPKTDPTETRTSALRPVPLLRSVPDDPCLRSLLG